MGAAHTGAQRMIEVHYCIPSNFGTGAYATGSSRFESPAALQAWLTEQLARDRGPVIVTKIEQR